MKTKIYRNILVQYKGGGYDGCFWEWNFFLFDSKGTFHNLMSTGRKGIKTKEEAKELLKTKHKPAYPGCAENVYKFNLKIKKQIKEFQNETHQRLVSEIVPLVNKVYKKDIMYWECDDCLDQFTHGDMYHSDEYHWTDKLCGDCYCNYVCGYCGTHIAGDGSEITENGCIYCHPEIEIKIFPKDEFGKRNDIAIHLLEPDEIELERAKEKAQRDMFHVICVYKDETKSNTSRGA